VAVILVHYDSSATLAGCLDSLAAQTRRPDRIVLVDNASRDQAWRSIVERHAEVEVLASPRNLGFAAANNLAIERVADCQYVALLNVDAFAEPEWLERLLAALEQSPAHAFCGSELISAGDTSRFDGTGDVYHVSGRCWRRDVGRSRVGAPRSKAPVLGPCAAAALYRRDALLAVGGFDERYFCYLEDVDLDFRLRLAGYRYLPLAEPLVRHVGCASTGRHSDFSIYHGHRNLVWTYVKNMPGMLFWLYLPQHLLLNLVSLAMFIVLGRARPIVAAKLDALRGLGEVWKSRRSVQSLRVVSTREVRSWLSHGWATPYLRSRQ
jgi:GT2 family glycosyltransferase